MTVTLHDHGPNVIQAIKVYRAVTRAGLREAKTAVESAPVIVGALDARDAARWVAEFQKVGCVATAETGSEATTDEMTIVAGGLTAELRGLAELHAAGALSDEEFAAAKARVLVK